MIYPHRFHQRCTIPASYTRPEPRAPASRRFAAVGLWVNGAIEDIQDQDGFENGPGLGCAAASGSLSVISLILSIAALVLGGKEGGAKYGGAPEAVSDTAKDVEMAATR